MKYEEISIDDISPRGMQVREIFDKEELKELSDNIKEMGVIQPILVVERARGRYEIVAGERRWKACKQEGQIMSDKHVERMVCVRKRFPYVCAFAVMFFSAFVLVSPIMVKGEVYDIPPKGIRYYFAYVEQDSEISWKWHCTNPNYVVDFWIEDSSGRMFVYHENVNSMSGSFKVPYSDTWYVKFYNKDLFHTVTVDATVTFTSMRSLVPLVIAIGIGVSVVVTIVLVLLKVMKKKHVQLQSATFVCNVCGCSLRFIPEYNRWYCDNCKKYL